MARAFLIIEALENERMHNRLHTARLRRNIREQARQVDMSEDDFRAHYRLTKELFRQLCNELSPYLPRSRRRSAISIESKVLTALSVLATGSYQEPVGMGSVHGLSQPSVSKALREVVDALNHPYILANHIYFPRTLQERRAIINGFSSKFGFPGCLGCIDCTHVAMIQPQEDEDIFLNRKHYHSRNVQIICDSNLNILSIDASFGGATHDAHIWRNSEAYSHLRELHSHGETVWFLGDSGYPLRPWLLTPIINAAPGTADEYYTNIHSLTRNTVEQCIGVLKARWRCLLVHRVLHYDPHMVAKIINACAILHNICNRHQLPVPELPMETIKEELNLQVPAQGQSMFPGADEPLLMERGRQQQAIIVQQLWNARRV